MTSGREGGVRMVLAVLVLAAVVAFGGCSSVEPTDPWAEQTGRLSGTVRSDTGELLEAVDVWLWAEQGAEGNEVTYHAVTDPDGYYYFGEVEIPTEHAFEADYWLCVNRMPYRTNPIDEDYECLMREVSVPRDDERVVDIVLEYVGDTSGDPDSYIDD